MTDADYAALKADIKRHFDWWLNWLGLGHWEWEIEWHRTVMPDSPNANGGDGMRTPMRINAVPDRLMLYIDVDMPVIASALAGKQPDDETTEAARIGRRERELERMVVHELSHALVAEMRPLAYAVDERSADPIVERAWKEWIFHEERVVAQMTLALIWVANEGHKRPRRIAEAQAKRAQKRAEKRKRKKAV